ncbi:2-polyprenyl-6-methoxyphenol hydroxylase [Amycolatopsis arida]|uniref:2-polyprenyl-6-methoxyphenol hydroxylase n=1 Tax=Amycolatopsis arida TaxID=587909 RepID=A0A1I5Q0S3_9PSEU|nr:FAD-dependent monooxygenase [Amycolatopsis arida]TDX98675.1 2-polyprenyl-6-methoxyphenol hydroxylase-like FAD-dependent oxidoreductase [Amycolatopsis arida]SFP39795.1 2-polyprenyl-6-methoxyphenol hydroxylase [Amycolatopsis arida]
MRDTTVLISGASVAGPVLAHWLRRHGFRPIVVERAPAPRPGGQAIDIRGVALDVVERMGVLDEIRATATGMRGMSFVDESGTELMRSTEETLTGGRLDSPDVEIMRGDLAGILRRASAGGTEYVFGDRITGLAQSAEGVEVTFAHGAPRTVDLVIGADGLHSGVRALAFGPERDFLRFLGTYVAVFSCSNFLDLDRWQVFHRSEGKMTGVFCARENTAVRALMGFESAQLDYDSRDVDAQKRIVEAAFAGEGWEAPRLIKEMWAADDFYFDSVSQIVLDRWSSGRVALVGDAGYAPSLLSGQGTSLAIVGAYVLAGELARAGGDHTVAFPAYESRIRDFVERNQRLADHPKDREPGPDEITTVLQDAATALNLPTYP